MKSIVSIIFLSFLIPVMVNAQQIEKGKTTVGSSAVSETVSDIMARQILGAHNPRSVEAEKENEYPDRHNLPQNSTSPGVSSYSSNLKIGNVPNNVTSSATISKGLSFTGGTLSGGGAYPPDNMGSVGPTQYIVAINSIITSFNKTTGVADGVLNNTTDNFFASVMSSASGTYTSDPRIRYDRLTKRWYFLIIDVPAGGLSSANRVLIGVSADSIITPSTVIKFFYYQNTGNFIDYPTMGIDKNALYIGGNIFNLGGTAFLGSIGLVVQKSSIQGTGPMVSSKFSIGSSSSGIYTPQGVDNLYDLTATEGYFIGVDAASYGILDLVRVNNPGSGSPSVSSAVTITVPTTYTPGTFYAKPGSSSYNLDPDDERLFAAMIRNGHIWTAHHIETTNAGVGSSAGTRISARWYDLINYKTGFTPALNQSGTVYSNTLTTTRDRNFGYPTISANGQGHALMGFTIAGYYSYANAGYTYRLASDPAGTMTAPDSNTASSTSYNPGDGSPHRWGDYSMTEVDPTDDMTFWTIQQYCNGTNNYGCRVSSFKAPAPAPLISATPNVLGTGSNLTLLLKGDTTTTTGLGFYEPGSGFSKHLSVSIDGNITVNSISYVSPGTILITVNTTSATDGARTVTVTNPDGQVVSSGSILTYHVASSPVLAVTPTSLTGFNYSFGYGPSLSQSYNLSGSNLTGFPGSITVTAPTNFEVSLDDVNFAASKLVSFTSATLGSTAIHVRLKSGLSIASYLGYVTNAGGGAATQNDTCSGVVNPVPSPTLVVSPGTLTGFNYSTGAGPSSSQSYTLSGTYLTPSSGSITVQCLTNYEVSTDSSTFSASVSPSYSGGMLSATKIFVRLKAGLTIGNYNSETVSNAGGGASTQYVTCSGGVYDIGALFTDDFSYTLGTLLSNNGWVAHSGAGTNPPAITSPGLTYGNYLGSGVGNAVTLSGDGEDDNHSFTNTSSASVYASAMIKVTSANSTGDYFFHFGVTGSTSYNARVFVKSASGGFVFGVCKSATTGNIQWSPTVLATGSNNFIVLKYTFVSGAANDNAELFINPAVGGVEPASSDLAAVITDADFTAIDKICLRQSSTTPVVKVDGIRVGQTWASVTPRSVQVLTLTAFLEGVTNAGGTAMRNDFWPITGTVELHDGSTLALVEAKTGVLSTAGVGTFTFTTVADATPYYIVIKFDNSVETWSAAAQSFTAGALSYNFSTAQTQAYGSNMIQKGSGAWCIYSGDVSKDGTNIVDGSDVIAIDNDNTYSVTTSAITDLTGDGIVDGSDVINVDNNNTYSISRQAPGGAPVARRVVRPGITQKQDVK
jgi:hypothetical protein